MSLEVLKCWLIRKHLSYCRAEVGRLEEWLRVREARNVEQYEKNSRMAQFFKLRSASDAPTVSEGDK